jgi:invasion protein IalB
MGTWLRWILVACTAMGLAFTFPAPAQQVKPAPKPARTPQAPLPAGPPPAPAPTGDAAASLPAQPEWTSRCASDGRHGALECAIEQNVFLSKTGQLIAAVSVRVPADTHQPAFTVQVPLGLFLPAGISLQVDDNRPMSLAIQTCDAKGCYAVTPISPEMLGALKAGKKLAITFQNLSRENISRENISVPLQLANFAQAYQKIE